MRSLLSEVDAAVWERSRVRQKYFDDRLCSGISEWPKQHMDAVNEIGPLLVKLSRLIAQSRMTFSMCMVEFIQ